MTRKTTLTLAAAAALALALATYALAVGYDPVPTYTGCLKNGKLDSLAAGDTPLAPCGSGTAQVRLSGGDITAVTAGDGLRGGGDNGDLLLTIDPQRTQVRVGGRCNGNLLSDESITAINQDGTVVCNPDDAGPSTDVYSGFYDGPVSLPAGIPQLIAQLPLPAGKYGIVATLDVGSSSDFGVAASCQLQAGADFDETDAIVDSSQISNVVATRQTLQVVHSFADPGAAVLRCGAFLGSGYWRFLKITATRVADLSNQPLTLP